jgi:hypothetical protein
MKGILLLLSLLFLMSAGCRDLSGGLSPEQVLRAVLSTPDRPLDATTVAAGLKEALQVGTERTVLATSSVDGFLANQLIRIALPEQFGTMAKAMRTVGFGSQVDALEVAMNRAAERAAGEAKTVFWNAIRQMTVADAFEILNGGDTAATSYFRDRTEETLRSRFQPIVEQKMGEVGLYRIYEDVVDRYRAIPFVTTPPLDLGDYVTDKSMNGLFLVLAQEEKRIREDPLARTTELLRRVFGRQGSS